MITNIELVLSIYSVLDSVKSNYTLYRTAAYEVNGVELKMAVS